MIQQTYREQAGRKRERLISARPKTQMDRGEGRMVGDCKCQQGVPPLPVFTRITTSFPLLRLLCMHDDLFVTEEKGNESTNLENMMMKMVVNDHADGSFFFFSFWLDTISPTMQS